MQDKVVWAEGILLSQQHFQQWEDFWQQQQWQLLQAMQPDGWGLLDLDIDRNALSNGNFRVRRCSGIFPDGLWFQHSPPKTLSHDLQLKVGQSISVYLAIADNQAVSAISGYNELTSTTRWQAKYRQIADKYDEERQREILLGELNLQLVVGAQSRESLQKIKIAEIRRESHGQYLLLPDFIATSLNIGAGTNLNQLVMGWQEQLKNKINYLRERHLGNNNGSINLAALKTLILLPWLSTVESRLYQFNNQKNLHPKEIFKVGLELISALNSLATDFVQVDDLVYLHDDLTTVFRAVEQRLFTALASINSQAVAKLHLQQKSNHIYHVEDINPEVLHKQRFFIAVFYLAENIDWLSPFIRQIKIAASSQIDALMTSALAGVPLIHTQRPPPSLETKAGYEYFYLNSASEAWQQILLERNLTIFIPKDFLNVKIELITV